MKLGAFRFLPIHLVMFEDTTNYDFWDVGKLTQKRA